MSDDTTTPAGTDSGELWSTDVSRDVATDTTPVQVGERRGMFGATRLEEKKVVQVLCA